MKLLVFFRVVGWILGGGVNLAVPGVEQNTEKIEPNWRTELIGSVNLDFGSVMFEAKF